MARRLFLIIAALGALLVALAAPASAQYQPGQPGFILDPPVVEPRGNTTVIGNGCPRNSSISVTIDGRQVGTGTANDDDTGSFTIPITAPDASGDYIVTVTCGSIVMTQLLTVVESDCGFTITGAPGATVTASFTRFQPGTAYTLIFASDPVQVGAGTIASDPQTVTFTIPSNAAPGAHTLSMAGTGLNGATKVLPCPVEVTAVTTLPRTGSDSGQLVKAGALMLGVGGLLVLIARRSPRVA